MIRGTGHIADPDSDYRPAYEIVGTSASAPPVSDGVRAFCPEPLDQGGYEGCCGTATSQALFIRMGVEGLRARMPSWKAIWYFARHMMGNASQNVGCRPIDAFAAIEQVGYPDALEWPDAMPFDRRPDSMAMRFAQDREILETGRVLTEETEREEEIKRALHGQFPVCAAFAVDDHYMRNDGVWTPGGNPRGWHYIVGCGYDRDGMLTLGSYGPGHGKDGYTLVPWSVIRKQALCRDIWTMRFSGMQEAA